MLRIVERTAVNLSPPKKSNQNLTNGGGGWHYVRHCSLRIKKTRAPLFQAGLGRRKKNKQIRNRTASTVRGKLNLGQVQSAARLLALIIEQCHGPLSPPCLPLARLSSSRSPVLTTRSGNTAYKKSLIRSLGFSRRYGRRWVIDCREIANWKKGEKKKKEKRKKHFPLEPAGAHLGGLLLASSERIPHLVIGPGAAVSAARSFPKSGYAGKSIYGNYKFMPLL